MIYLLAALFAMCLLSVGFKLVSMRGADMEHVIFCNYAAGLTVMAAATMLGALSGQGTEGAAVSLSMVFLAAVLGFCMIFNLCCTKISTDVNGLGKTTFFNRIGFLLCLVLIAVLWKEVPGILQVAGIVLVVAAFVEMLVSMGKEEKAGNLPMFALLFAGSGMISFFNTAYGRWFREDLKPVFLLMVFSAALIYSFILLLRKTRGRFAFRRDNVSLGVLIGVSNAATTYFTLKSLEFLSAPVVMSVSAAGNLLIVTLIGRCFFGENGNRHTAIAMLLAAASLVLMNI